jgi:flagellin
MGFRIQTNVSSLTGQRHMRQTREMLDKSLERLSSGFRINKAGDDAAGLAISEKLKSKLRGLGQAQRNANDGVSLIQTAEGALSEIQNMLTRLRELGVQAASDTVGPSERMYLDKEYQALKDEIDRITYSTNFNGINLIDGSGGILEIQVDVGGLNLLGVDRIAYDAIKTNTNRYHMGIADLSVDTKENAQRALEAIIPAIDYVSGLRSDLGSLHNRLTSTINNIGISIENLSAANSRIRDVDIADETANLTRNNILLQAGTSVLQQANSIPQMALQLLKGG